MMDRVPARLVFVLAIVVVLAAGVWAASYRVGPGDKLDIIVLNEPGASGAVTVNPAGQIQHSLLGLVEVKDLTAEEIQGLLTEKLKRYIRIPKVTVTVLEFNARKVYVFGGVGETGQYPLKENTTLLEILIKEAGGITGQTGTIQILRNYLSSDSNVATSADSSAPPEPTETIQVDFHELLAPEGGLSKNVVLQDGDIIYVPSTQETVTGSGQTPYVYVFGAVESEGIYPILGQNYTALNAVLAAGGFDKFASENRVRLIRKVGDHKEERIIRLGDVMKGQKEKDVVLQAEDVLVVPEGLF